MPMLGSNVWVVPLLFFCWSWSRNEAYQGVAEESPPPQQRQDGYPEGFFPFVEGEAGLHPPRVRKPPYRRTDLPCPGADRHRFLPRDTLCGDLNKGLVPRNPMGQQPLGEPYPFALIRNKTLEYFSRTLPFLKSDPKLPKVAKFVAVQDLEHGPPSRLPPLDYYYQRRRVAQRRRRRASFNNDNHLWSVQQQRGLLGDALVKTGARCKNDNQLVCVLTRLVSGARLPLAVLSSMSGALTALREQSNATASPSEVVLAMAGAALRAALNAADNDEINAVDTKGEGNEGRLPWAKVISTLASLAAAGNKVSSPLSTVVDLVAGSQAVSNFLGKNRRRTKPNRSETVPLQQGQETPCPSLEEYVTPTFARNYQGVWKYIVQIPQEGYFTQTVQNIKCGRSRCEFTEGVCHESPRWVSLLVAELYYPQTMFPTHRPGGVLQHKQHFQPPPVEDFPHFQQYLKRRVGSAEDWVDTRTGPEHDDEDLEAETRGTELGGATRVKGSLKRPPPPAKDKAGEKVKCDGHDETGCFVVRMYYDWFLINGSCKCWKASLKRVLYAGQ